MTYALGIDLGGSSVKCAVVTPRGEILERHTAAFDPDRRMHWAETILATVAKLQDQQGQAASFMGVSAPGLANRAGRAIAFMPGRLEGLEGLDWTDFLAARSPVPVLNDAHAALLGETWIGAARDCQNAILLTLGTGVGGAAKVDGRLLLGHIGRAGHLGHNSLDPDGPADVCGAPGSLEMAIGNCTIRERSGGAFETTHALIEACRAGQPLASEVWGRSVKALAAAVASYINILDPEAVIIGGGIARAGDFLFGPLHAHLERMEWRPGGHKARILPATLGEMAGAIGAAWKSLPGHL